MFLAWYVSQSMLLSVSLPPRPDAESAVLELKLQLVIVTVLAPIRHIAPVMKGVIMNMDNRYGVVD